MRDWFWWTQRGLSGGGGGPTPPTGTPPPPPPETPRATEVRPKVFAFQPCGCSCILYEDGGNRDSSLLDYATAVDGEWLVPTGIESENNSPLFPKTCVATTSTTALVMMPKKVAGGTSLTIYWDVIDENFDSLVELPPSPPTVYVIFNCRDSDNYWYVVSESRAITAGEETLYTSARVGYVSGGVNTDVALFMRPAGRPLYAGFKICLTDEYLVVSDLMGDAGAYAQVDADQYPLVATAYTSRGPTIDDTAFWFGVSENGAGHEVVFSVDSQKRISLDYDAKCNGGCSGCCSEAGCCCHNNFRYQCAPCCYGVTLSGFTGNASCLDGALPLTYSAGTWIASFFNHTTRTTEAITLEVTKETDQCVLTLTVGSLAVFECRPGQAVLSADDVFSSWTRISGDDGACESLGRLTDDECDGSLFGCGYCKCLLSREEYKVVISGIVDGTVCGGDPARGHCNLNGTYILSRTDTCGWTGPHITGPVCGCGGMPGGDYGGAWYLLIHEKLHVTILCPTSQDEFIIGFESQETAPFDCLFLNELVLVPSGSSNWCDTSNATCVLSAVQPDE